MNKKYIWQTTPAPDVASVWHQPVKVTRFGTRGAVLSPISVFERPNKNKIIIMKQHSNLNHLQLLLFHTFPPPLHQYNLFWPYKKRAPKPLLGCQNWVTSKGGCQNLVPGWHSQRRRRGMSYIAGYVSKVGNTGKIRSGIGPKKKGEYKIIIIKYYKNDIENTKHTPSGFVN